MKDFIAESVERGKKELGEHPAMKFANDAIILAAVRGGTQGYTGEENLAQWFEKYLRSELQRYAEEMARRVEGLCPRYSSIDGHEVVRVEDVVVLLRESVGEKVLEGQ